jgi:hypothetical protein
MKKTILAFFLAPIGAAITVNSVFAAIYWLGHSLDPRPAGTLVFPNPNAPWEFVLLFSLYGIPTALVTLALVWLPVRFLLTKMKVWNLTVELITSIIFSIPVMILFDIGKNPFMISFLAIHGIITARLFGLIETYIKKNEPNKAVEPTIIRVTDCAPSSTLRATYDRGSL